MYVDQSIVCHTKKNISDKLAQWHWWGTQEVALLKGCSLQFHSRLKDNIHTLYLSDASMRTDMEKYTLC